MRNSILALVMLFSLGTLFGQTEDMNGATGVKCYFDIIVVNGQVKNDYSPVKGERIKNENG